MPYRCVPLYIIALLSVACAPVGAGPLHDAAREGDLDRVQSILRALPDVNAPDQAGYTALHYAALGGHLSVMKRLLYQGAHLGNWVNP